MFVDAELCWGKALLIVRAQPAADPALLVDVLAGLAVSYRGQGRPAQARQAAVEALQLLAPGTTSDDALIWRFEREIGTSYGAEKQPTLAIASHRRALEAAARHPELRENVVKSQMDLSMAQLAARDSSSAVSSAQDALETAKFAGTDPRVMHDAISNLIAIYVATGRWEAAQRVLEDERGVLRIWRPRHAEPEDAPLDEGLLRPRERGRVANSGEIAVRLSDAWAYCAYKFRSANAATARLTTVVGPSGSVSEVTLTAFGLDKRAADCMVREAAGAKFPPPEGDGAVVVFATETFPLATAVAVPR